MAFDKEEAYRTLQDLNTGQKTPVSLVMELATHLRTEASFEETSELKWNPNIFKYHAKLGNIRADGEGRSKKEAKQNSAQELLSIIQSYGSKFDRSSPQVGVFSPLKYSSPSPSSSCRSDSPSSGGNAVGELQNLAAKNKWKLPVYDFLTEEGEAHCKTFTCLVKMMSDLHCTGIGSTKKSAKKQAAEKMLDLLQGDHVDSGILQEPLPGSPLYNQESGSDSSILDCSELDEYNSSSGDSPLPKWDASGEAENEFDKGSVEKLKNKGASEGFNVEFIFLPNKSKKGLHQVFVKLTFNGTNKLAPVVTHGSGETEHVAKCRGADRALKHLEIIMSLP